MTDNEGIGVKWWKKKLCWYYWVSGVGGRLEDQNGENPKRNYFLYFQNSMHIYAITQA